MEVESSNIEIRKRYELLELIIEKDLVELLESFTKALSVTGGIVKHPEPGDDIPESTTEFDRWRLTPVIGFDKSGKRIPGGSRFCEAVRTLDYGNKRCMKADLMYARTAFQKRCAQSYNCPSANLIDIVAPIRVGGHHLANVYFGQLRNTEIDFDKVWEMYQELKSKSNNAHEGIDQKSELEKLYKELRTPEDTIGIPSIKNLLQHLAELISRRASRQAVIKVVDNICGEIVSSFDLKEGMKIILGRLGSAINFQFGSIMVVQDKKLEPVVSVYPPSLKEMSFELGSKQGAAMIIFKKCKTLRYDTRDEMNAIIEPAYEQSRLSRNLQSFLGTPIILDGKPAGIIEVSNTEKFVYTKDDERLIELIAKYVALHIKSNRENQILLSIARERYMPDLFSIVVEEVPKLVNGRGCSIFLRKRLAINIIEGSDTPISLVEGDLRSLPSILVETTELERDSIGKAFYEPDRKDGLSGYILATGESLNIPGGKNARITKLNRLYPGAKWKGKYRKDDTKYPKEYYKDRPFLGVPIKGSDGIILGLIRVPDSVKDKMEFSDNDQAMLEACAAEVAVALEANSVGHFLHQILKELSSLKEQYKEIKEFDDGRLSAVFNEGVRHTLRYQLSIVFLCCLGSICTCGLFALVISFFFDIGWYLRIYFSVSTLITALVMIFLWIRIKRIYKC